MPKVKLTASEKAKAYRAKNPGKAAADAKKWREANPLAASISSSAYYAANRESEKARTKKYRQDNPEKFRELERQRNAEKVAKNAARRGKALNATPAWLTKEQKEEIKSLYISRPPGYDVDHVVPLIHPMVCGLHVPWNLQHLLHEENLKKGNQFPWNGSDQLPAG